MTRALGYVRDLALHGQAGPGDARETLAPPRPPPAPHAAAPLEPQAQPNDSTTPRQTPSAPRRNRAYVGQVRRIGSRPSQPRAASRTPAKIRARLAVISAISITVPGWPSFHRYTNGPRGLSPCWPIV